MLLAQVAQRGIAQRGRGGLARQRHVLGRLLHRQAQAHGLRVSDDWKQASRLDVDVLMLGALPEAILETVLSRCVETSLEGGKGEPSAEEKALLQAVETCLLGKNVPSAAEAFRLTRTFQALLTDVREKLTKELETALKAEAARYKQASEGGDWLQERTEQVKALSESAALRERDKLIGTLIGVFGDALRVQQGQPAQHPTGELMARMLPASSLFHCLDTVETMRRRLALGVQEALALEAGILETTLAAVRDTPCEKTAVSK